MLARFRSRPSLLVVGAVTLVIAIANPAAAPPGDLDPTFDGDGMVTTDFAGTTDVASTLAIQGDAKIVAAGFRGDSSDRDFALARYNTDGSLDTTFDGDGRVTTQFGSPGDHVFGVVIQIDGKIVAAGRGEFAGSDFGLGRYNINGSLDTTFDGDGMVFTDFFGANPDDVAMAVALQGDGRIVAAGSAGTTAGPNNFALARYNTNGSLDATFDGDGRVTTDFAGAQDEASAMTLQGDGKIVVAGTTVVSGTPTTFDFALARYNADGSLDTTFDGDGKVTTAFASDTDDVAFGAAIQGDGKIVVAGASGVSFAARNFALARYNSDGSLDITFDGDGLVTTDFAADADEIRDLILQGNGKIVAAGFAIVSARGNFALARYNSDGSLDTTFNADGKVTTDFAGSGGGSHAVAIQGDGKIVAAGNAVPTAGNNDFALARYQSQGVADLVLTKTDPPGRAPTGMDMTYTVTVTNNGPDTASGVTVIDQLPPSVTFVSATASQGSCNESGGIVTCNLGMMGNGATARVNIVVKPTVAGTITNTAAVTTFDEDPNQSNNSDSEDTSVCRITSRRSSIPCG